MLIMGLTTPLWNTFLTAVICWFSAYEPTASLKKKYIIGILSFFIFIFNKSEFDNTSRPPPPPLLHGEKAHFYSIIQVSLSWCPFTMKKNPQLSGQKSGQYKLVHGSLNLTLIWGSWCSRPRFGMTLCPSPSCPGRNHTPGPSFLYKHSKYM